MADIVKIQVRINEPTQYGDFKDAIYYNSLSEYATALDDGTHEAEKAQRVANYIDAVQNPPAPVEMTKEELEAIKLDILTQATAQIAELDEKIAVAKPTKDIGKDVVAEEIIP
jgi:hypothetical protein